MGVREKGPRGRRGPFRYVVPTKGRAVNVSAGDGANPAGFTRSRRTATIRRALNRGMDSEVAQATQVIAMLAAWRAEIASEPFPYTDAQLLAEHRRRTEAARPEGGHSPA